MKVFSLIVNLLIIIYQVKFSSQQCSQSGCIECDSANNCLRCSDNYILDQKSNSCVYTQCDQGLYLQTQQTDSKNLNTCVAVCQDQYVANAITNTCDQNVMCSSSTQISNSINPSTDIQQSIKINDDVIAVIQKGYVTLLSQGSGFAYKIITFSNDIILFQVIQGQVFITKTDGIVYLWDLLLDSQKSIYEVELNYNVKQITLLNNQIVCLIINDAQNNTFLKPIFNLQKKSIDNLKTLNFFINQDIMLQNDILIVNKISFPLVAQQIKIQENQLIVSSKVNCAQILSSNLNLFYDFGNNDNYVIQTSEQNLFLEFLSIKALSCQKVIISSKILNIRHIITSQQLQQFLLLIQQVDKILVFDQQLSQIQVIGISLSITDLQIASLDQVNQYLILLDNNQYLQIYKINNQFIQFQQKYNLLVQSSYSKIYSIQVYSQTSAQNTLGILVKSQSNLQIITFGQDYQNVQTQVIANYNRPYPQQLGTPVKLIIIDQYQMIAVCYQSGTIGIFDVSSGFSARIFNTLQFQNQSCKNIENVQQTQILVQLDKQIQLLDLFTGQVIKQFNLNANQVSIVQISVNGQYSILQYNNCIEIYNNSNFSIIFKSCDSSLVSSSNMLMMLNYDLSLIIVRDFSVTLFSISLNDQSFSQINQYPSQQKIIFAKVFFTQQGQIYQNSYKIDEIAIVDSTSNLFIININFQQIDQIKMSAITQVLDFKRVQDDNNQYFLMLPFNYNNQNLFSLTAIKRDVQLKINSYFVGIIYSSFIVEAIKLKFYNDQSYYMVSQFLQLNVLNVLAQVIFKINNTSDQMKNYYCGQSYLFGPSIINQFQNQPLDSRNLIYNSNYQGQITSFDFIHKRYKRVDLDQYLSQNENIVKVFQSGYINKYFVMTDQSLMIFDIFEDTMEEKINFDVPSNLVKARNIDSLNSLVISQPSKIFLRYFDMVNGNKDYNYKNMYLINGWIYSLKKSCFYIYGSGIQSLDQQLNLKKILVNENKYVFTECFITLNQIICLLNTPTLLLLDLETGNINYQLQIQGFSSNNILMKLDYDNEYIFLAESYIQVFTFKGTLYKTLTFQAQGVKYLSVEDVFIVANSNTFLLCYDRKTLNLVTYYASPSALNIVKIIYVQQFQQIIFFLDSALSGQILIFSMKDLIIQTITTIFSINGIGRVIDFSFYIGNTRITFLDEFGNIYNYNLFGAYQLQGFTKIVDILDRDETLLGMSIDYIARFMFSYSQKSVYKSQYTLMEDKIEVSYQSQQNLFTVVQVQNNENQSQFLVLNNNNMILRYQNYHFVVEFIFNEKVQTLKYVNSTQTLVVAFSNYLQVIQNYQYGKMSYQQNNFYRTQNYQFKQFIDDNIFITYDYKMVHYDYTNLKEIKQIQLIQNNYITSFYIHQLQQLAILGFYNGDMLIYNKLNQVIKTISSIRLFQSDTYKKQIKFLLSISPTEMMISSIQGDILRLNLIDLSVSEIVNIKQLLGGISLLNINLNFFMYDDLQSRLIFSFYGSSKGYVYSLDSKAVTGYITSGNFQNNHLILSSNYIIIRNSGVINIYRRNGSLAFLSSIYSLVFSQTILQVRIIDEQFLVAVSAEVVQVYLIKQGVQTSQTVFLQYLSNPQIIEYSQKVDQNGIFRVLFLTDDGVIEINISADTYLSTISKSCSYQVNSSIPRELELKTLMVKPLMIQTQVIAGVGLSPSTQYKLNIFLQTQSTLLPLVNGLFKQLQQSYNTSLILSSDQKSQDELLLTPTIFSSIQQKEWDLINFSLSLSQECNISLDCRQISYGSSTSEVRWQDITISSIQQLRNVSIIFQNLNQVTISNLTIQLNYDQNPIQENIDSLRSSLNSDDTILDCLLCFENVQKVNLYQIKIIGNSQFSNGSFSMILVNKVDQFHLQDLTIINNQNIKNIFKFTLVSTVLINKCLIQQNNSTFQLTTIFNILSSTNTQIRDIKFYKNENVSLINSTNIYQQSDQVIINKNDQITAFNISINENILSSFPLIQLQNSNITLNQVKVQKNSNNIRLLSPLSVKITESLFSENESQNGGAIYIYGLQQEFNLISTQIFNNEALSSGGGIYFEDNYSQNWSIDSQSQIYGNQALIGGGIRIVNILSKIGDPWGYPYFSTVKNNQASIYGNNACTFLKNIQIEDNNQSNFSSDEDIKNKIAQYDFEFSKFNQDLYYGKINLNYFNSGGNLQLKIYLLDEDNKKITFSKEMVSQSLYPPDILEELKYYSIFTDIGQNKQLQLTGEIILNYNMYDAAQSCFLVKQLVVSGQSFTQKQFILKFQLNQYSQQIIQLIVDVSFRKCLLGEVSLSPTTGIQICYFCSDGSYSLVDPNSDLQNTTYQCQKCPVTAEKCYGNVILLKNGYWRANNTTDEILTCDSSLHSCQAQNPESSSQGCTEGYLGPLCEECDTKNQIWQSNSTSPFTKYISSFYSKECNNCSQIPYQFVFFAVQVIAMLLYFIYNSYSFILNFENTQQCYYLRRMQFLPISKHMKASQSTSFVKIILTYLQFSNLLIQQPNFIPIQFNILPDLVGSPNQIAVLSTSCLIPIKIFQEHGKALVYSILNLSAPFFVLVLSLILIIQFVFTSRVAKYYIYFTLIYTIYTFFMVDIVQFFIRNVTCRQIGSQRYHSTDLLIKCDDAQLKEVIFPLSATVLSLWCLFPMIALFFLYKSRNKLQNCKQRYIFGYFYQEFQLKKYYWEFIRIYLKIFTIIQFTLLRQSSLMSTRVITVAIFGAYIRQVSIHKPFQFYFFSKAEVITFQILIVKLILITLSEQIEFTSYFLELAVYSIDYLVILYIGIIALKLFFEDKNSLFYRYVKICAQKFLPKLFQNAFKVQRTSFKTYLRWKKIHKNLSKLMVKKSNQLIIEKTNKIKQQNSLQKPDSIQQLSYQQFTKRLYPQMSNRESDLLTSSNLCQKILNSNMALFKKRELRFQSINTKSSFKNNQIVTSPNNKE